MNSRWLTYSFALLALLGSMSFGYACKGGGDTGGAFLEVLQTSPEDRTTNAPVETRIGFQIDAPIDAATLTDDTFFVTDPEGTRVQGTVAIGDEPDIAVLTPDEPLAVITSFTATITTGLRSSGGATLEEDFDWRFTTLDSEWGDPEWLEQIGTGSSSQPQIVIDGQSNALAVWTYTEATGTSIWANRYTRTGLWEEPELIDTGDGGTSVPQVAADAAGNGFAVWQQGEGGSTARIWTNRYVVDEGWGTPELLQNGEVTAARDPAIAADAAGNAIAIWLQKEMGTSDMLVWSRRYVPGGGWGAAEPIDQPIDEMPGSLGGDTAVGMDADGNAIAMWTRPGASISLEVIWANRYTPGAGWGTAGLIKADGATNADGARLSVGPAGDAFVVWVQNEDTRQDVWGARFSGSSWGTPERIDRYDAGDTVQPDVAVDGMGVAVDGMGIAHAVWSQSDPDFRNIWASQYTPGAGWGAPELIEPPRVDAEGNLDPDEDANATNPRVAVNTAGNAFVVWSQFFDNWISIWSNRLDPDTGWMIDAAELIEEDGRAASAPKIAVDEKRHAHAVWPHQIDGEIDWVRTNRFE
jgi:hypothetical protein